MGLIRLPVLMALSLASAMPARPARDLGIQPPTPSPPWAPGLPVTATPRRAAAASVCNFHWDVVPAPRGSVQRCQGFLADKGDAECAVPGGDDDGGDGDGDGLPYTMTQFCDAQDGTRTAVFGVTYKAGGTASACADVARAVEAILTACSVEGQVAGQDTAHGNGDLLVFVQHGFYYNNTQGN